MCSWSVEGELNLKKAASAAGEKSIAMIKSRELLPLTGYIHGGCSPLGMKKVFPTFIDETAILFDTIMYSGGRRGCQICSSLADLQKLVDVQTADITLNASGCFDRHVPHGFGNFLKKFLHEPPEFVIISELPQTKRKARPHSLEVRTRPFQG